MGVWAIVGGVWVAAVVSSSSGSNDGPPYQSCNTAREVRAAAEVRRAAGRQVRDLSSLFSPFLSSSSIITQVLSFLPGALSAVVSAVSSLVYTAGTGVAAAGLGLGYSGKAVEVLGSGIRTASNQVPAVVTVVLVGSLALLTLFPGIQQSVFSTFASGGLALAGEVSSRVRGYVDDNSLWATLLDTLHLFIRRARQDLHS